MTGLSNLNTTLRDERSQVTIIKSGLAVGRLVFTVLVGCSTFGAA